MAGGALPRRGLNSGHAGASAGSTHSAGLGGVGSLHPGRPLKAQKQEGRPPGRGGAVPGAGGQVRKDAAGLRPRSDQPVRKQLLTHCSDDHTRAKPSALC